MRNNFISNVKTIEEKHFWEQFFDEVEKRKFVKDAFTKTAVKKGFGVHIHGHPHFKIPKYSLMYTREGSIFKMNNQKLHNNTPLDGLDRLKCLCVTQNLPDQFYFELTNRKLLSTHKKYGKIINIPILLKSFTPADLNDDLFQCIDLFR